ncbi:alpha-hydroxy acid oxidase [Frondihabitans australicus]|uniref:4-hydroxymandelate oxidase n=1 Tax=Frondihabitans australicus TaxID=386892 RepID=A0A495ICM1_9MICO|nr:alpha-hydroxy acid oxidase [Frondihabitans australicus]RKR73669.1 4-hydroxymandelate oxidase [Frondihabitans australicus]
MAALPYVAEDFAWPESVDPRAVRFIEGYNGTAGARNVAAWQGIDIVPRMLRDSTAVSTAWTHTGLSFSSPIVVAPWASQTFVHPEGERATSRGAADSGSLLVFSSNSATAVGDLPSDGAPFYAQVYVPPVRDDLVPYIREAERAGALGLVLTLDTPPTREEFPFRAAVERILPPSVNFAGGAPAKAGDLGPGDIEWLRSITSLPVWVKGVLATADVELLLSLDVAGIIVSNHGGRQLGAAVTTAWALPRVVDAVAGRVPVWVDSGIRSGEDAFRGLALGADAVLVGRPAARALTEGAEGVARLMEALREELHVAMMLSGVTDLAAFDRSYLAL